jgi:hypothetical protein
MAFCRSCGAQVDGETKFCPSCGQPTGAEVVESRVTEVREAKPVDDRKSNNRRNVGVGCLVVFAVLVLIGAIMSAGDKDKTADNTQPIAALEPTAAPTLTPEPTAPPPTGPRTSFDDGQWVVGSDIESGTYHTEGSDDCYWERLSGFGGSSEEIIANNLGSGPQTVTIAPTDKGFSAQRCGTWTKV